MEGVVSVIGGQVLDYEAKRIRNQAFAEGEARTQARINLLFSILFKAGRTDDAVQATQDVEYQMQLMKELLPAS